MIIRQYFKIFVTEQQIKMKIWGNFKSEFSTKSICFESLRESLAQWKNFHLNNAFRTFYEYVQRKVEVTTTTDFHPLFHVFFSNFYTFFYKKFTVGGEDKKYMCTGIFITPSTPLSTVVLVIACTSSCCRKGIVADIIQNYFFQPHIRKPLPVIVELLLDNDSWFCPLWNPSYLGTVKALQFFFKNLFWKKSDLRKKKNVFGVFFMTLSMLFLSLWHWVFVACTKKKGLSKKNGLKLWNAICILGEEFCFFACSSSQFSSKKKENVCVLMSSKVCTLKPKNFYFSYLMFRVFSSLFRQTGFNEHQSKK